jgi:metal transporter CNNM
MAGTLMGFMTLEPLLLSVKARAASTLEERHKAQALLPFTEKKNLVLVSILIVNCATNEALPLFLDQIVPGYIAVILSVTLGTLFVRSRKVCRLSNSPIYCLAPIVVVAGEIIPSAYFMGKDQINVAYRLIPLARFIILITSPISYPFAKLLDANFREGEEKSAFKRGEVSALVRIQYEERMAWKRRKQMNKESDVLSLDSSVAGGKDKPLLSGCDGCGVREHLEFLSSDHGGFFSMQCMDERDLTESESIDDDDIVKVEGALAMKNKTVAHYYTRMHNVFAIPSDTVLDEETVVDIYNKGYSRVPVYDRNFNHGDGPTTSIRGILLTRQLLVIDKTTKRAVSTLQLYRPVCLSPDTSMADAMNAFQAVDKKTSHMAIVCVWPEVAKAALHREEAIPLEAGVVGIITLENVIEELIQAQIHDEKDRKDRAPLERAKWATAKWKAFVLKKRLDREDEGVVETQREGVLV